MKLTGIGPTNGGGGGLTPPTLAPVLMVTADLGSYYADLAWTASNKTGSAGFGYHVYDGSDNLLATTTGLSHSEEYAGAAGETYSFYVVPFNDAGEGPSSNTADVVLPGESDGPVLSGPSSATSDYEITWTAIAGATEYDVYQSPDDGTYSLLTNTSLLAFTVTYDYPGMYHKVIPKNGSFEGTASNTIYVVLSPPPSIYLRPDGSSSYLRPDGTSIYLRP